MSRILRLDALALVLPALLWSSCGSSPTATSTASPAVTFHSETSDSPGDAIASAGVASPPDLVHGTVDVAGGSVTFTIQFASGTMSAQTTRLTIQLDTDQNPSTGINGGNGVGIDYVVDVWAARVQQTLVQQAQPASCAGGSTCYTDVGTVSATLGTDTMATTVPLAMLGNTSGRITYRVFAYASPQPTAPTVIADVMPDFTQPAAHVP
jgi:hypothetical protein